MPTLSSLQQLEARSGLNDINNALYAVGDLPSDEGQALFDIIGNSAYSWKLASIAGIGCWQTSGRAATAGDGDFVGYLVNLVDPAKSFVQATDAQRPRLYAGQNGINGRPALAFGANLSLGQGSSGNIVDQLNAGYTVYFVTQEPSAGTIGVLLGTGNSTDNFYIAHTATVGGATGSTITVYNENIGTTDTFTSVLSDTTNKQYHEPVGVHTVQVNAATDGAISVSVYRDNVLVMQETGYSFDSGKTSLAISGGTLRLGNFSNDASLYTRSKVGAVLISSGQHTAAQRAAVTKALNSYYRRTNPALVVVADSNWSGYGISGSADSVHGGASPFAILTAALNANNNASPLILTGSAIYDASSLGDGAGESTTVTVVGAALGDYAVASLGVSTAGISVTANVTAADTVTVRVQNESGGTVDMASTTLSTMIIKRDSQAAYTNGWVTKTWAAAGEVADSYGTIGVLTTATTANKLARRLAHYAAGGARSRAILYVALGQNDLSESGTSVADTWALLKTIITNAKAAGMRVVVQTLLPRNKDGTATKAADLKVRIDALNALILSNAKTLSYTVADAAAALTDNQSTTYFQSDFVHVNALGAVVLANVALSAIKRALGVRS